jgi:predicted DNA-binding protein (UPF0251 family)
MTRPKCCRKVDSTPDKNYFKPRGIPASLLEEVILTLDEYEAVRLADFEELYQEKAASQMNISRQTFGRIIESAHKKIADVLINGKALKIEGGQVSIGETKSIKCRKCHKTFNPRCDPTQGEICPHCQYLR